MQVAERIEAGVPGPDAANAERLEILVVETSGSQSEYLQDLLDNIEGMDYQLTLAASQTDALRFLGSGRFDIAFIDYCLGGRSGAGLIRAAGGRLSPTPMVLIAEAVESEDEQAGLRAGATDFLTREDMTPSMMRRVIKYARFNHNTTRKLIVDEQRYREIATSAAAASGEKTKFMAHMSHELRTPLNAIIGFSEVIQNEMFGVMEGEGRDRYREYIRDIHSSSQHLLSLINDLLDLSKIEAGKFEISPVEMMLSDVVRDAIRMTRQQADTRGVALAPLLPADDLEIYADRRLITQAVLNVTANAVKFTPAGGEVRLSARSEGQNLVIAVEDTGCGIAAEDLVRVMEPFQQAGALETRPDGGTGLGLPLARSIMELHQGGLEITSIPGRGTSVYLWLPRNVRRLSPQGG